MNKMGYWHWWIKHDTSWKLYCIYFAICIIVGCYNLIVMAYFPSYPLPGNRVEMGYLWLFIIIHPAIIYAIYTVIVFTYDSYQEYKKGLLK